MHRYGGRIWQYVALYVVATMVVPYAVVSYPSVAQAQAQPTVESAAVAVLPIEDPDGAVDSALSLKATDALALALEETREFSITPKRDLDRELANLELTPPLSVEQQLRLGKALNVDKIASGRITQLRVNPSNGQVTITMYVGLLDVAIGELLDGAEETVVTKPIPGWAGEETQVINEAIRAAADRVVEVIMASRVPEGFITSVNAFGVATVNLGQDEGLRSGKEMVLLRPVWQRDLEELILLKVGHYSVSEVGAHTAKLAPLGEGRARVGDRAYVVYSGPERMQAQKRKENTKHTLTTLFAVAALLGVVAVADGEATSDAPVGVTSHLFQQAPGDEALIRVSVPNRSVPLREQIHAWLFFRGDGQQFFSLTAENLVAIRTEPRLPGGIWDDSPVASGPFEYDLEFDYITSEGDEETIDLTAEFMHPALQVGHTYYHRVQRIVDPMERAGSGAPIATTQVRPAQVTVDYELEIDPPDALSEGSKPTNGVTYFTPPILVSPEDGAANQSTRQITFTWNSTLGANEYVLQVFPEDDPDGRRNPEFQITKRHDTSGVLFETINFNFDPSTRFYWRVGARRSGEALPECGRLNQTGWLFSDIRTFSTAAAPPPPPGTSAAGFRAAPGGIFVDGRGMPRYRRP